MTFQGVVKIEEVQLHAEKLDTIIKDMAREVEQGTPEAMKNAIISFKEAIAAIIPGTEEANPTAVLNAVRDPTCLALQP